MQTLTIDHNNGHSTTYKLIQAEKEKPIAYHKETSDEVVQALEYARKNHIRIQLYLGDTKTGRDWHEEHDTKGYVGLSKGRDAMFPILVYNERSMGGGSILDHCIVKIKETKTGRVLYQNKKYQVPQIEIKEGSDLPEYSHELLIDGSLYSRHKNLQGAERLKKHFAG